VLRADIIYDSTDLPFPSDDEFFQFVRAQDHVAHVHVLLRQPLVSQTFSGGKSFPVHKTKHNDVKTAGNDTFKRAPHSLFSLDQQRAYKVLGILRHGVERVVVEIEFRARYVGERLRVVVAHERRPAGQPATRDRNVKPVKRRRVSTVSGDKKNTCVRSYRVPGDSERKTDRPPIAYFGLYGLSGGSGS